MLNWHEVDHIISIKHDGPTSLENLALFVCNRYKGTDIAAIDPETGSLSPFFHPRQDVWQDHFSLSDSGLITPRSATGRVTVRILQLNKPARVSLRAAFWRQGIIPKGVKGAP